MQFTQSSINHDVIRLRNIINRLGTQSSIDDGLSEVWYEITTKRIDEMYKIEKALTNELTKSAKLLVEEAANELAKHEILVMANHSENHSKMLNSSLPYHPDLLDAPHNFCGQIESLNNLSSNHTLQNLLHKQATRLDEMNYELIQLRQSLNDQKIINRAKLVLISEKNITETEAYKQIRSKAMSNNVKVTEIAQRIIDNYL